VATQPQVAVASPVLELQTLALAADGTRRTVRVLGIDPLVVAQVAPGLQPVPDQGADRLAMLSPDTVFLNAAARALLPAQQLRLQAGLQWRELRVAGSAGAGGGRCW
jgi:putative ABC transport system permease protein